MASVTFLCVLMSVVYLLLLYAVCFFCLGVAELDVWTVVILSDFLCMRFEVCV